MNITKETLTEIATTIKAIEQTEETISRASKLFSYPISNCNSLFIQVGGGSVHCSITPETREEADILQQAIELVLNNRLEKANAFLSTVLKDGGYKTNNLTTILVEQDV